MIFYISRVFLPAFPIDVFLTIYFANKGRSILAAFAAVPLYFISAIIWIIILGASDPRFAGQGVIGLIFLGYIGIGFSIFRLILGLIFFILKRMVD